MRTWVLIVPASLLLASSFLVRADDLDKEKEKLQGTWKAIRGERFGFPLDTEVKDLTLEISGDKMTFKGAKEVHMSFVLGSTKEHKTFDMTSLDDGLNKGHVSFGIYSCEDDLLAICSSSSHKANRPTAFATLKPPGPGRSLYIFKRVQP